MDADCAAMKPGSGAAWRWTQMSLRADDESTKGEVEADMFALGTTSSTHVLSSKSSCDNLLDDT